MLSACQLFGMFSILDVIVISHQEAKLWSNCSSLVTLLQIVGVNS